MTADGDDLDELLLGGPRRYTRDEAAASSGVSVEYARRLWRAMGFANVGMTRRLSPMSTWLPSKG